MGSICLSFNLRIVQEYFQPKIGRKIRIFSMGRKNNIQNIKKSVILLEITFFSLLKAILQHFIRFCLSPFLKIIPEVEW